MKKLRYEEYDTTAIVTAHLTQGEDTVYIEFGGILGHVRAITSAMLLLNHRKRDSGITLDGDNIHLERSGHYRVFTHKAPERKRYGITTKAIILHEQFTSLAEQKGAFCILLPADYDFSQPPPHFFERLRLAIDVPISVEWQEWLWQKAQAKTYERRYSLIRIIKGYNIASAVVYTNTASWLELVREQLNLGCVLRRTDLGYSNGEWELREIERRQWTIFHNGERATMVEGLITQAETDTAKFARALVDTSGGIVSDMLKKQIDDVNARHAALCTERDTLAAEIEACTLSDKQIAAILRVSKRGLRIGCLCQTAYLH